MIVILGLTYWWLLGWGIPFIDHAMEDGRYDDVVMIAILWLLPISAYSWFRKCQNNPGWDTDTRPIANGRSNFPGWF